MIGFLATTEVKYEVANLLRDAQVKHIGRPINHLGEMWVHTGLHAGQWFIPFPDEAITMIRWRDKSFADFPEFAEIVALLGGLESRVTIDPQDLIDPNAPQEP
jgi:hypothetical protein